MLDYYCIIQSCGSHDVLQSLVSRYLDKNNTGNYIFMNIFSHHHKLNLNGANNFQFGNWDLSPLTDDLQLTSTVYRVYQKMKQMKPELHP